MKKYRVNIIRKDDPNGYEFYVSFANKPDMYKWLTVELNQDKSKEIEFKISQIKGE